MHIKPVTHVIFDMDGLLIDSEAVYQRIMNEIGAPYGKQYDHGLKVKILGTPEQETARIAVAEWNLPLTIEEFLEIYRKKAREYLQGPALMAGAEKLVRHLYDHNVPIAVATSSTQESMECKSQKYSDLFQLFDHIVCGGSDVDVKKGKPAPDIFLVCAERFPIGQCPKPEQCLVLEDAPNGVKGATEAGMQTVMVPDPDLYEDYKHLATVTLKSLVEFRPEIFGLPPYKDEQLNFKN